MDPEACSETCQISKMEFFAKIFDNLKLSLEKGWKLSLLKKTKIIRFKQKKEIYYVERNENWDFRLIGVK